ncbi:hypothetical protein MBLNU457_5809t1 [Dothideomycetes sp. NU457]
MCIALLTTTHPSYALILLSNRDEYLTRPTAPAHFWSSPHTHVLGGRDLQRPIHGTWLGITRHGRLAVLTNYREQGADYSGLKSRGGIVNAFLTLPPGSSETSEGFAERLVEEGVGDVGGFSLVFGTLRRGDVALGVLSNRTTEVGRMKWLMTGRGETVGLSNSFFGDRSWPKVVMGERMLEEMVMESVEAEESKEDLIERGLRLLSTDTLPKRKEGESFETYIGQLRHSIFIPRIGGDGPEKKPADEVAAAETQTSASSIQGKYATQKQTVVLVDHEGHVTFVERTTFDEHGHEVPESQAKERFEFDIEGWGL